jgi:hypothetical protein
VTSTTWAQQQLDATRSYLSVPGLPRFVVDPTRASAKLDTLHRAAQQQLHRIAAEDPTRSTTQRHALPCAVPSCSSASTWSWTEASSAAATSSPALLDATNHLLAVLLAPGTGSVILPFLLFSPSCRTWTRSLAAGPGQVVLASRRTWTQSLAVSPSRHLTISLDLDTGLHWTTRYMRTHHCNLLQH